MPPTSWTGVGAITLPFRRFDLKLAYFKELDIDGELGLFDIILDFALSHEVSLLFDDLETCRVVVSKVSTFLL